MAVEFQVRGADDIMRVFDALPGVIQKKILRPTFTAAGKAVVNKARANLRSNRSERTGTLIKSMGTVVKINRNGAVGAYVGPRRSITGKDSKGRNVAPWRYAHLVERGGRGGRMPARPFLEPAFDSEKRAIFSKSENKMRTVLQREVGKLSAMQRRRAGL